VEQSKIRESTFVLATNGFGDGPAQALRDYLIAQEARGVIMVNHPLSLEDAGLHTVTTYSNGSKSVREYRLPNRPPYTFPLDPLVPLRLPRCTAWFGFNNLGTLRGLVRRRFGRTLTVCYWAVDFVPNRFGDGIATRVYENVDRIACMRSDMRVELSTAALQARSMSLGLDEMAMAPAIVVPMGAWLSRAPRATEDSWNNQTVVYLGHLVPRQGVATLLEALPTLVKENPRVTVEIIGGGPLEGDLRALARRLDPGGRVTFHGFVDDHREVEHILSHATVAVAPYLDDADNFTRYADPGKLKSYLAAGLPIVLTAVPPNASDLADAGAARLIESNPVSLAAGVGCLLGSKATWTTAHLAALDVAQRFDWNTVFGVGLERIGFA
jgi:glycosyltransferase involved in cell wall biosynthesis